MDSQNKRETKMQIYKIKAKATPASRIQEGNNMSLQLIKPIYHKTSFKLILIGAIS